MQMYELCDRSDFPRGKGMYLRKQTIVITTNFAHTYRTVVALVLKVKGAIGHNIFMRNYFISPKLSTDQRHRKIKWIP
jgi:hypothetical protein